MQHKISLGVKDVICWGWAGGVGWGGEWNWLGIGSSDLFRR